MKSDSELDALVAALRDDLPSERDSVRLRARLSALGLAASQALVSSSAAAVGSGGALGAGHAAGLGAAAHATSQAGALSLALKAGAVVVVSASLMAGPVWIAHQRWVSVAPADSGAMSKARRAGTPTKATSGPVALPPSTAAREERAAAESAPSALGDAPAPAPSSPSPSEALRAKNAAPTRAHEETPARAVSASPASVTTQATAGFAKDDEASATPPTPNEPTTLREETRLIDGALAALRVGDAGRALELLSEHQRRFPAGLLRRERQRALDKANELRGQRSAP